MCSEHLISTVMLKMPVLEHIQNWTGCSISRVFIAMENDNSPETTSCPGYVLSQAYNWKLWWTASWRGVDSGGVPNENLYAGILEFQGVYTYITLYLLILIIKSAVLIRLTRDTEHEWCLKVCVMTKAEHPSFRRVINEKEMMIIASS